MTIYDCRVPKSFIVVQIRVLIFEINAQKIILTFSYVAIKPFENNLLEIDKYFGLGNLASFSLILVLKRTPSTN